MVMTVELFGTAGCPFTAEMREHLELGGREFVEHDVETDPEAFARLRHLTGDPVTVPVLVESDRVTTIGWRGRGCAVTPPSGTRG